MNSSFAVSTLLFVTLFGLSACSNNKTASTNASTANKKIQNSEKVGGWQKNKPLSNMQKIEAGKIVSIKIIPVKPEKIDSYGSVGVSVGSGGHSGIYGAFDIATLGKVLRNANKPKTTQQFIIQKTNGEMVAITQAPTKETFNIGDSVKLLLENGRAKVIH